MRAVHWLACLYFLSFYVVAAIGMLSLTVSIFVHNFLLSESDILRIATNHSSPAAKAWLATKDGFLTDAQERYQKLKTLFQVRARFWRGFEDWKSDRDSETFLAVTGGGGGSAQGLGGWLC